MRIKPNKSSERIPQRTLLAESPGVTSKGTIRPALEQLIKAGVIREWAQPKGSRKPSVIIWALECPPDCLMDHYSGNAKTDKTHLERELEELNNSLSKTTDCPNPQTATRPNPQTALTSINKRERSSLISIIEKALNSLEEKTDQHLALLQALNNPEELAKVQARAEQLAIKSETNLSNYLAAIVTREPWKLLPKDTPKQAPPDFSHLPPAIREAQERKLRKLGVI